jgi:hypothetical protein
MAFDVERTGHNQVAWEGSTSQPRTTKNSPSKRKGSRGGKLPPLRLKEGGRGRRFGRLG